MNAVVPMRSFSNKDLALIRRTVAKDCNTVEFDLFMHICQARGLDPLRRHIYAWVFNKDDDERRNLVPVVSQEGQLCIANRTGNYRPDAVAPTFVYDETVKDPLTNPLGLVSAEVTLFLYRYSEWHPVTAVAYWDEYAPIVETSDTFEWEPTGEVWEDTGKPRMRKKWIGDKRERVDPKKTGWIKSPRIMLAKCARMQAARLGWPDDFGGLYALEEMDRQHSIDATASELAEAAEVERRMALVGTQGTILFDLLKDGGILEPIPVGELHARCMEFLRNEPTLQQITDFESRNRHGLREFWAKAGGDALDVKKAFEKAKEEARTAEDLAADLLDQLDDRNTIYSAATIAAWLANRVDAIGRLRAADAERVRRKVDEVHAAVAADEEKTEPA